MPYAPNARRSVTGKTLVMTATDDLVNQSKDIVYSGVAYANVAASAAISNTVTETAFSEKYTLPKNSVRAGTVIRVRFQGIATATNGTDTLAVKLYVGGLSGTAILTLAARDVANNDIFTGEAVVVIRTIGSTGTFVSTGSAPANPNAAGTATNQYSTASATINTAIDNDISVSAQWSMANAGNSCRLDMLVVELS